MKLGTDWIRELTANDTGKRDDLASRGRDAIEKMEAFWASGNGNGNRRPFDPENVRFTFLPPKPGAVEPMLSEIIGE